ncbi:MAG: DUF1361 domain-containing protein [Bacteroidetes bacterium]|nr:DUF1361 domain-containing protein [Bacteroidota bacterium]
MKLNKLNDIQKLVTVSVMFTLSLLFIRAVYTHTLTYFFYPWNLFLGLLPLFFSGMLLRQKKFNLISIMLLSLWLLFLPNAPYLVTDIFHFETRPPIPQWFDLMLVVSGAWNGILFCMISLLWVEKFLRTRYKSKLAEALMFLTLIPCGYGIYIGRYLRYNSWDVVTDPVSLIKTSSHHLYHPFQNLNVWLFTMVFAVFLGIIYFTIKKLPQLMMQRQFKNE